MIGAEVQTNAGGEAPLAQSGSKGRVRSCVGCGERVDLLGPEAGDLVRLVLGPGGEIAVDAGSRHGGGFGRGAHLHTRPDCLERAAKSGLARATKGKAHLVDDEGPAKEALSAGSLARAIQAAMDRRIEGLLAAAVRSRRAASGADAVTGACKRGEAALVVVRRAVAEGRAVSWGTKQRLGAIAPGAVRGRLGGRPGVSRGPFETRPSGEGDPQIPQAHEGGDPHAPAVSQGIGVIAISSRPIAEALRQAVHAVDRVSTVEGRSRQRPRTRGGQRGQEGASAE
jgi:predicted RNA-binding protein YlxR (DUF448 family)